MSPNFPMPFLTELEFNDDLSSEQQILHKQCQELIRRTRRVQIQQTCRNLTKQMKMFVSGQQKLNSVNCQRFNFDFSNFINAIPTENASFSSDLQAGAFVANQERASNNLCNSSVKTLSRENKNKNLSTIDTLRYNLRHLESKYDSDATDSSSGGESCDELEEDEHRNSTYTLSDVQTLPVSSDVKRHSPIRNSSNWKWCSDRSSIASRWSWLQAQVTYLETKLRQQNDIFRHLRATKGQLTFGDDDKTRRQFPSSSSINNTQNHTSINNHNHQSPSIPLSSSLSQGNNTDISSENTLHSPQPNPDDQEVSPELLIKPELMIKSEFDLQPEVMIKPELIVQTETITTLPTPTSTPPKEEDNSGCMRTIPFVSMKKRKLVRSEATLSLTMKKAVKYSSIQCSCNIYPSYVPPCVICNGRYSYMHSIDTEFMPFNERVSLLDSSCHPVLCLPNDVPLGIYFMQLLKRENIHYKPALLRNNKKKKLNNATNLSSTSPSADGNQKASKKLITTISIPKLKAKIERSKKRRQSTDSFKKFSRERFSSGCSSRAGSPVPSPSPSDTSSNGTSCLTPSQTPTTPSAPLKRRRRSEQHAFDINNIVIPFSIAAATRVERLQYKEIITPKWRINEEFSIPPPENIKQMIINSKENGCQEEVSQTAFEIRHSKYEQFERQRLKTLKLKTY